jgi:hypothetical protein
MGNDGIDKKFLRYNNEIFCILFENTIPSLDLFLTRRLIEMPYDIFGNALTNERSPFTIATLKSQRNKFFGELPQSALMAIFTIINKNGKRGR